MAQAPIILTATLGQDHFSPQVHHFHKTGRGLLNYFTYQVSKP